MKRLIDARKLLSEEIALNIDKIPMNPEHINWYTKLLHAQGYLHEAITMKEKEDKKSGKETESK